MKGFPANIALVAWLFIVAPAAFANTVQVFDVNGAPIRVGGGNSVQYEASCSPSVCIEGFYFTLGTPGEWDFSESRVTGLAGDFSDTEDGTEKLNVLLGLIGGPDAVDPDDTLKREGTDNSFTTNREYFSVYFAGGGQQSAWTAFFRNTSDGSVTVNLKPQSSFTLTEYGAVVPLPAAAWLFGSGVLALLGFGYRRKSALKQPHGVEAVPA